MIKSYAVISPKGGTGKTTVSLALAAGLARRKKRVLLVDADQQEDSTVSSGLEEMQFSIADVLNKKCKPLDAVCKTSLGYDILPCYGSDLAPLAMLPKTAVSFKNIIKAVSDSYDYLIVDCPPNISGLTVQVLEAIDEIVFPAYAESFSERSLGNAIEEVLSIRKGKNKKLTIAGVLLNKYRPESSVAKIYVPKIKELTDQFGIKIFDAKIPDSVYVLKAQDQLCTVYDIHDRERNAAAPAFDAFVEELTGEILKEDMKIEKNKKNQSKPNGKQSPKSNGKPNGWKGTSWKPTKGGR